ncbi:MAG: glycosyltransferase [Actinomycetota bacterium]|nr:glycosyltransferase [Actinomycetota bacterium]
MTRLLFDALGLDANPSGTRTRIVRLVPALLDRGFDVTVAHRPELDGGARRALGAARLLAVRHPPARNPLARLLVQRSMYRRFLSTERPDVVIAETWPMPDCPGLVPVIHDLRYLELRRHLRRIFVQMLSRASQRAVRVHVASETIGKELVGTGVVDPEKVDVVPGIVTLPDVELLAAQPSPRSRPYVLVVGHAEQRKDYALVHAVAGHLRPLGLDVVAVGRSVAEGASTGYRAGGAGSVTSRRGHDASGDVHNVGIVSDDELERLYVHARAVLAPSRYEGFGLVPLEALAAGAWVVASDIPVHREVLGEAASYFGPGNVDDALARLRAAVAASNGVRQEQARAGRERAARFSAARAAACFERSLQAAGRA